jgi:hypothetical protein
LKAISQCKTLKLKAMKNFNEKRNYCPPASQSVAIVIEKSTLANTSGDEGNLSPLPDGFNSGSDILY